MIRWTVALLLASCSIVANAHADEVTSAEAGQLYEQGLKDMLTGKYDAACSALARSHELEPLPGAAFTVAECYAKWGKHARSLASYKAYLKLYMELSPAERAQQRGREEIAGKQVRVLAALVPTLTIELAEHALSGTTVTLDGEPLAADAIGVAQKLDPGSHVIVYRFPDGTKQAHEVHLGDGDHKVVKLNLSVSSSEAPIADAPPPNDHGARDESTGDGDDGDAVRTAAFVVGGIGVAGLIVGGITGGLVLKEKSTIDDHCIDIRCDPEGLDAADRGQTFAAVSTAMFIIGGAALAGGVAMYLLAPGADGGDAVGRLAVVPIPTGGTVMWEGRF